jgi:signal transduction histidine kinase
MKPGEKTPLHHRSGVAGQPQSFSWRKAVILAMFNAVVGAVLMGAFGYYLEQDGGLDLLFHLRGVRSTPSNVVIVSLDRKSADRLGLSDNYANWPHSYYTRLIQKLRDAGASVIAFDVFFDEARSTKDDDVLAKSIASAGNVILVEDLRKKIISIGKEKSGRPGDSIIVEQLVPPTPVLARAAAAIAPFPLPKVPVRVSQYWTFEQTGDVPTFPSVIFQLFSMQAYGDLKRLLNQAIHDPEVAQPHDAVNKRALDQAKKLLTLDATTIRKPNAITPLVRSLRKILGGDTLIAKYLEKYLDKDEVLPPGKLRHRDILKSLVNMYRQPNSRYLNFYGPPGAIPTISFYQALQPDNQRIVAGNDAIDFKDKIVFVGNSDTSPQSRGDFFNTVYSLPDGRDLSGVEIAATAFANLLENAPIKPLEFSMNILTIIFYGIMMGLICYLLRPLLAAVCLIVISVLYIDFAAWHFTTAGLWFPVIIPVAIQAPFAFTAAILWKYYDSRKTEVAHEQLRELDRLKTMFLSQVTHELKAPLTSIQGFVDNMLDGMTGDLRGKQREYLQRVRENTERLTRMITNLLDLSRIESGTQQVQRVPCRLFELVEQVTRQFEPAATARHLTLDVVCDDPTTRILADQDKFVQILTNLLDNAIKFTPAGGKVTVSVSSPDTNHTVLSVTDTGMGISAEAMGKLFEPFYQASKSSDVQAKGLGLGLSIVKNLVEMHDGTISVSSEPGVGSEFRIVLPALVSGGENAYFRAANL